MKKTNHKLVGLALLYLSTTFTFSGNAPVYAGTREFDNLIRYEVHQSQIWLIFFVKS